MYITELLKQELRFRKQISDITVKYRNSQGEYTWNRETKNVYYKDHNRKYPEYIGTVSI